MLGHELTELRIMEATLNSFLVKAIEKRDQAKRGSPDMPALRTLCRRLDRALNEIEKAIERLEQ